MAMNYMPVPFDYLEEMETLSDREFGQLIRWGLRYQSRGETPPVDGKARHFVSRVRLQVDRYVENYNEILEKKREGGRNSARKQREARLRTAEESYPLSGYTETDTETKAYTDTETETDTNTETEGKTDVPAAYAGGTGEGSGPASLPPMMRYGEHVRLSLEQFSALLRELGTQEFARCRAAVDLPENEGADFPALIRAWHQSNREEGMEV